MQASKTNCIRFNMESSLRSPNQAVASESSQISSSNVAARSLIVRVKRRRGDFCPQDMVILDNNAIISGSGHYLLSLSVFITFPVYSIIDESARRRRKIEELPEYPLPVAGVTTTQVYLQKIDCIQQNVYSERAEV